MDQIKWENFNLALLILVRDNALNHFWDEDVQNPAYPDREEDLKKKDGPSNVNVISYTFGGPSTERGISGYLRENFQAFPEDSIQYKLWDSAAVLFDSIHRFTVGLNNNWWHEYPEYPSKEEEKLITEYENLSDKIFEQKEEDEILLEDDILELSREQSKKTSEDRKINYQSILEFINKKNNLIQEWSEYESWEAAKKELLTQIRLYLEALGPNKYLYALMESGLKTLEDQPHLDWRINPLLRDFFLGFLFRNPIFVNESGKLTGKDPTALYRFFVEKDEIFDKAFQIKGIKENNFEDGSDSIAVDCSLIEESHFSKFKEVQGYDMTFEEYKNLISKQYNLE